MVDLLSPRLLRRLYTLRSQDHSGIRAAMLAMVGELDEIALPGFASYALASPKSSTFTLPSARHFDVAGFQIAMDDAFFMRGLQRLRDLLRDCQRFVNR